MTSKSARPFVPADFEVPTGLETAHAVLLPLGPVHNESDHAAWTSSISFIRATPGFGPDRSWPVPGMSLEQNLEDLEMHQRHFDQRVGFTYTVLDREDPTQVVGCVYIYPDPSGEFDAEVRSWVTATRPELDIEVWRAVSDWMVARWPFAGVRYADRSLDA